MKHLALTFALIALLQADACDPQPAEQYRGGYIVRICSRENISDLIDYSNKWLAPTDVRFVQSSSQCDVTVEMMTGNAGGIAHAEGVAYAIVGKIEIQRGRHPATLMHEVLHCAGVGHENDPTSIMWRYAGGPCELRPHHAAFAVRGNPRPRNCCARRPEAPRSPRWDTAVLREVKTPIRSIIRRT